MEGQEEMKVRDRFDKNRIGDLVCDGAFKYVQNFAVEINGKRVAEYDSLDGVAEDWEDYKPAKPLIKDEKIRKAIRAWAEVLQVNEVESYGSQEWIGLSTKFNGADWSSKFELDCQGSENTLVPYKKYTIAELCGEEEE